MKVVILAGGYGTRLGEESEILPKPLVEIGGKPILWHIMKIYSHYGFNKFVILLGYKGHLIKEYFANYFLHQSDLTIDLSNNGIKIHDNFSEPWEVTLLDTGLDTMTGGRILRAKHHLKNESFFLTYGDGLANVDIPSLLKFHKKHKKVLTLTRVQPEGRFGSLKVIQSGLVHKFVEKPSGDHSWINGGFFVCNPTIFDYLQEGDKTIFEKMPLEQVAKEGELFAYKHSGFWRCMDTIREKIYLNKLWNENKAQWKIWS